MRAVQGRVVIPHPFAAFEGINDASPSRRCFISKWDADETPFVPFFQGTYSSRFYGCQQIIFQKRKDSTFKGRDERASETKSNIFFPFG